MSKLRENCCIIYGNELAGDTFSVITNFHLSSVIMQYQDRHSELSRRPNMKNFCNAVLPMLQDNSLVSDIRPFDVLN